MKSCCHLKVISSFYCSFAWVNPRRWRCGKTENKIVQLILQHCCKTSEERCCAFYQPHSNLSCNKSGQCKLQKFVAESRVVLLFATKSVHVVHFKGRCKLVLQLVTQLACMTWLPRNFLQSEVSIQATCNNLTWLARQVWTRVVKHATLLFNLVLKQCCKTSHLLLLPFLLNLRWN